MASTAPSVAGPSPRKQGISLRLPPNVTKDGTSHGASGEGCFPFISLFLRLFLLEEMEADSAVPAAVVAIPGLSVPGVATNSPGLTSKNSSSQLSARYDQKVRLLELFFFFLKVSQKVGLGPAFCYEFLHIESSSCPRISG